MIAALVLALPGQTVSSLTELQSALRAARPGAQILLEPGEYRGGGHFANVKGTAKAPIVIRARDPKNPPRVVGPIQFSSIEHVEIHDLVLTRAPSNGINIDDGGTVTKPSRNILLKNLRVSDLPKGNHDGIKLSGVDDFRVENCTIERWGGSGIDMVGCHRGVITGCTFRDGGDNAVQTKGGSSDILVERSRFENAGQRALNIGGSTGLEFFRPSLASQTKGSYYEAKNISVQGCAFLGSVAPIAFVGVDGALVSFNTIYNPGRWAIRILQETRQPGFVPSRNGVFSDNIVVFQSSQWASGGVNVGDGTAPDSFRFARNWWFCSDRPERSQPSLPSRETDGKSGVDPLLLNPGKGDLGVRSGSPAGKVGAHAYFSSHQP